tara:strand:+ start:21762 stop:22052 length:291 start_codon:yes stop_codon:yes gene_type:complete
MSRSYNIWNEINSCAYASAKSYGIKDHSEIISHYGSSATHSKKLGKITYTRRNLFGDWYSYCILLDGKIIRQRYFNNKTKEHRKRIPRSVDNINKN